MVKCSRSDIVEDIILKDNKEISVDKTQDNECIYVKINDMGLIKIEKSSDFIFEDWCVLKF